MMQARSFGRPLDDGIEPPALGIMPHVRVAMQARGSFAGVDALAAVVDIPDDRLVAMPAVILDDLAVVIVHENVVGKPPGGEGQRVEEPVARLAVILADEVVRGVAVVAGGELAVRGFHPGVELFAHDVAIGAGLRTIGEIRGPVGVAEGEHAQPAGGPDEDGANNIQNRRSAKRESTTSGAGVCAHASAPGRHQNDGITAMAPRGDSLRRVDESACRRREVKGNAAAAVFQYWMLLGCPRAMWCMTTVRSRDATICEMNPRDVLPF